MITRPRVRGEGPYLFAEGGERYLDFGAGIAVNAFGHANPRLIAALTNQAHKLWHTSNLYRVPGQESLSKKFVEHTFADTAFFTNSGAEACECAFKMARRYQFVSGHPERFRIITFKGAFHGRTLAGIAAGGQEKYLEGFGPKVEGFDQVPPNDLKALEAAIGPQTAALMIEPIQGEGGLTPMPPEFLRALRKLCDDRGLLLVFDEIQCGVGRTGRFFAYEWLGIAPDIMCVAKGMTAGTHGSTYGGNPLAMAVGNEAIAMVLEPGFLEHVQQVGGFLRQQLGGLIAEHSQVFEEPRGQGLMLGLKLRVPNTEFVAAARKHGLLVVGAGENVVRLLPPLILTEDQAREGVQLLSQAAAEFETAQSKTVAA